MKVLVFLIAFAFIGYLGLKVYLLLQYQPQVTSGKTELKNTTELEKIQAATQFTDPVSSFEPTGRSDPLAPF